jgi:hypothetical protein
LGGTIQIWQSNQASQCQRGHQRSQKGGSAKKGRPSNAKRDLKRAEFIKMICLLEAYGHHDYASKFPTMMKTQFQMIATLPTLRLLIPVVILLSLAQQRL